MFHPMGVIDGPTHPTACPDRDSHVSPPWILPSGVTQVGTVVSHGLGI